MTTAEIESAANRGNLATADFDVGQVLRSQVIPQFLEDCGPCSWRKTYKTITTVAGTQSYDLDTNALKIHECYRMIDSSVQQNGRLEYIGEDPTKVALAEVTTTQAAPTGYYVVLNDAAPSSIIADGSATLTFSSIRDGAVGVQTFSATGAVAGGQVIPAWPASLEAGLFPFMRITATDTIEVRILNMSGAIVTPAPMTISYQFVQTVTGVAAAAWQAIKFQAPADAVYTIVVVQLTYLPFVDTTTSVNLLPYIPLQYHWALVEGLRAQIFFDRFGQGDPRYDRAQAEYATWVERAKLSRELGRRNLFVSVR